MILKNSFFEMSLSAAEYTAEKILASDTDFFISFPGGSTPALFFKILSQLPALKSSWHRVHVFQGDERYVSPSSPLLNSTLLRKSFFSYFSSGNSPSFYPVDTHIAPSQKCAEEYNRILLSALPRNHNGLPFFHLTVLGIGNDGHTASVFPNSPALYELSCPFIAVPAPVTSAPHVPRVTMTLPFINTSSDIIFLLAGKHKLSLLNDNNQSYPFKAVRNPIVFASVHSR
jgi:6-phosphogluconolactonase